MMDRPRHDGIRDFRYHPRDWRGFRYVYPVISRRSRGLSIGINLNPDKACNFDCVYCQVDRTMTPRVREVRPDVLHGELDRMLTEAISGRLFTEPEFAKTPANLRRLNDIAFSGDGEPTTCPVFTECVQRAADLKQQHGADDVKLILITDACYLTRPAVTEGLKIMDRCNGVIWAKLDAGTEAYYQRINRPNFPLTHVLDNILQTARVRPIVIQSLFMRLDGVPPDRSEIAAYADRLNALTHAGARLARVQIYTVARAPAETDVTPLSAGELDAISRLARAQTGLTVEVYRS